MAEGKCTGQERRRFHLLVLMLMNILADELLPLFRTPRGTSAVASRGLGCRFISGGGRPPPLLVRSSPSSEPDTGPSSRCALGRGPGPSPLVLGTGRAAETSWGLTSPASPPGMLGTLMPATNSRRTMNGHTAEGRHLPWLPA